MRICKLRVALDSFIIIIRFNKVEIIKMTSEDGLFQVYFLLLCFLIFVLS